MRVLLVLVLALLLAGCLSPGPADDASAGRAAFSCPAGQAVVGIDAGARIVCGVIAPATPTPTGAPARSLSITSSGALQDGMKSYTIASASVGMTYGGLAFTINGATRPLDAAGACPATLSAADVYLACSGSTRDAASSPVQAGDTIAIGGLHGGDTLRILDAQANAVILTLTIG
ncbi:MAG: hypothetical protein QOE90_1457 [Thermoplasmata archaeon]|jgi:hypothetical protein|nr:hypothetical protein [Thermoplasmata archaeon]